MYRETRGGRTSTRVTDRFLLLEELGHWEHATNQTLALLLKAYQMNLIEVQCGRMELSLGVHLGQPKERESRTRQD